MVISGGLGPDQFATEPDEGSEIRMKFSEGAGISSLARDSDRRKSD
jgi:hypothetical protein